MVSSGRWLSLQLCSLMTSCSFTLTATASKLSRRERLGRVEHLCGGFSRARQDRENFAPVLLLSFLFDPTSCTSLSRCCKIQKVSLSSLSNTSLTQTQPSATPAKVSPSSLSRTPSSSPPPPLHAVQETPNSPPENPATAARKQGGASSRPPASRPDDSQRETRGASRGTVLAALVWWASGGEGRRKRSGLSGDG